MDWGNVPAWLAVGLSIVAMGTAWVNRRDGRLTKVEHEISTVKAELRNLPAKDAVHNLELSLAAMKGQMDVLIERVAPIKAISERLQEVMLEGARK